MARYVRRCIGARVTALLGQAFFLAGSALLMIEVLSALLMIVVLNVVLACAIGAYVDGRMHPGLFWPLVAALVSGIAALVIFLANIRVV